MVEGFLQSASAIHSTRIAELCWKLDEREEEEQHITQGAYENEKTGF